MGTANECSGSDVTITSTLVKSGPFLMRHGNLLAPIYRPKWVESLPKPTRNLEPLPISLQKAHSHPLSVCWWVYGGGKLALLIAGTEYVTDIRFLRKTRAHTIGRFQPERALISARSALESCSACRSFCDA